MSSSYGGVVKLSLARLVAVSFGWPRQRIPDLEAERGDVTVRVLARQDGKQSALLVLVAEVPVEPPPFSDEHLLPVPTEPRRALESALEDVANAFAVFFMARRSISSVMPCVAFVPYDDEARRLINDAAGIDIGGGIAVPEALSFDVSADDFRLLEDRRDGAAC